ncbi:MAG: hypothetical protein KAJ03_01725 [Gammaproteobacteria bacterium]|nr:hypothetical protein [Gammaproteobacteria bacterium]
MTNALESDVKIVLTVLNSDAELENPTTVTIEIYNPDGTVAQADTAMTNVSTGNYIFWHNLASGDPIGTYTFEITATGSSGKVSKEKGAFIAIA